MNAGQEGISGLYACSQTHWDSLNAILARRATAIRRTEAKGGQTRVRLPRLDIVRVVDDQVVFSCSDGDFTTLKALVRGHEFLLAARARERDRRRKKREAREGYSPKTPVPQISRIDGGVVIA